jgi:serine phosphatase RsbU (regulator of sigma subunit)
MELDASARPLGGNNRMMKRIALYIKRVSLSIKMYVMLAPLVVAGLVVGLVTKNSLQNNARELIESYQLKNLTITSLALLLTQDDASKAILFDPDNIASDARKIKAYDENRLVLRKIALLSKSTEVGRIVRELETLDEEELRPLDTSVLELMAGGNVDAARVRYFTKYEPARNLYEALLLRLGELAETGANEASRNLEKRNQAALRNICVALGFGILLVVFATRQEAGRRAAEAANQTKAKYLVEIRKLHDQLKQENTRMSAELVVAHRLQRMMLPRGEDMRKVANLDICGFMEPATEVGGDYYDVICKDGGVIFGIGDVTGHGLESGVIAIMVQTAVRTLLANGPFESRKFFDVLNRVIYENARRMNCDGNLTLSLLHYEDRLVTISGQHEEVLVVRGNGVLERHDTLNLGFPLGLEEDISGFIAEASIPLQSGDVMVLYTDGITEAINQAGVMFGIERLSEAIRASYAQPADGIRAAVLGSLRAYIGGQNLLDDISLLVIKPD